MVTGRRAVVAITTALLVFSLLAACGDDDDSPTPTPTATQTERPTPTPSTRPTVAPTATVAATPAPDHSEPPARDLLDLAKRFRGYEGPAVARTEPLNHQVGDSVAFTLIDLNTVEPYEVTATVARVTDNAYFFVEDSESFSASAMDQITSDFEVIVWPTITGAFGEPWTPGVDGDPRITVLNARLRGAGGYFRGANQYPQEAVSLSAEREMLYIHSSALEAPGASYNSLVAHELQHLIHHHHDTNEESWVNEGLSQVAWEMAGGGTNAVWEFLGQPDTQLTSWPYGGGASIHYAASELFFGYVLDHYGGRENAKALAEEDGNGILGMEAYLQPFGTTFEDVFADFVVACLLDAPSGLYGFPSFDGTTTAITELDLGANGSSDVSQWGTDYYSVEGGAFSFDGADDITIGIPEIDGPFWWSNRSDGIDSRLTREVDLTDVSAATLTFDLWTDIESGWDYGYVAVSTDGGDRWIALPGENTTTDDPIGAAYGPGYTGNSGGWVAERVDLSAYAGEEILLRFEYITDDAVHLAGLAVDNIAIAEIGFADTADDAGDWQSEGFRHIDGPLEQEFIVQVIADDGSVRRLDLDAQNSGFVELTGPATIAISGATRDTTEKASYQWGLAGIR
ncbi:MAG TPA: hypothetical protein VMR52_04570 [Dehalococcoidia bacterium]|nr:hypothetical protein [Dehalococcoidia bacterium]